MEVSFTDMEIQIWSVHWIAMGSLPSLLQFQFFLFGLDLGYLMESIIPENQISLQR